jgi:hypothetical protein
MPGEAEKISKKVYHLLPGLATIYSVFYTGWAEFTGNLPAETREAGQMGRG